MTLFAVELKVTGTFSSYLMAESRQDAEQELRRRASQLEPDSVVFSASAYEMQHCERCGEEHFGPVCPMMPAARVLERMNS